MKTPTCSKRPLPRTGDTLWCIVCISIVLLGNGCNLALDAPAQVTVAYAAVSSVFAIIAGTAVACWEALQRMAG
jgi:hypothetical protein